MATALAAMLFDPVMKGFKNELNVMGKDRDVIKIVRSSLARHTFCNPYYILYTRNPFDVY